MECYSTGKSNGRRKKRPLIEVISNDVEIMPGDAFLHKYNLLLNIGPLPDGFVHPEDVEVLSNLLQQ
jgi:hypothetical protein